MSYLENLQQIEWTTFIDAIGGEAKIFAAEMITNEMPVTEVIREEDTCIENETEMVMRSLRYPAWVVLRWRNLTGQVMANADVSAKYFTHSLGSGSVSGSYRKSAKVEIDGTQGSADRARTAFPKRDFHNIQTHYREKAVGVLPTGQLVGLERRKSFYESNSDKFNLHTLPPFHVTNDFLKPDDLFNVSTKLSEEKLISLMKQRLEQAAASYAGKKVRCENDGSAPAEIYGTNYLEPRLIEVAWQTTPKQRANYQVAIRRENGRYITMLWYKLRAALSRN